MKTVKFLGACMAVYLAAKAAQTVADTWQIVLVNLENYPTKCVP